jgi:hypothetical protein
MLNTDAHTIKMPEIISNITLTRPITCSRISPLSVDILIKKMKIMGKSIELKAWITTAILYAEINGNSANAHATHIWIKNNE